jgi:hypothetical protein
VSRPIFAALASLLIAFPGWADPTPPPRTEGTLVPVAAMRAALAAGRDVRVALDVPLGEEVTLPTPAVGTAYTLEIAEGDSVTRVVYAAEAGRTLVVSRTTPGMMRLTLNVDGGQGQTFSVVANLRFVGVTQRR